MVFIYINYIHIYFIQLMKTDQTVNSPLRYIGIYAVLVHAELTIFFAAIIQNTFTRNYKSFNKYNYLSNDQASLKVF